MKFLIEGLSSSLVKDTISIGYRPGALAVVGSNPTGPIPNLSCY